MQKNDIYTQTITDLGCNGEGITKVDGITCFVPFTLIGEKVEFKVLKVAGNVAYCKQLEIITPADNRVRPKCSVFTKCGGCQLQHQKYSEQLKLKRKIVKTCFKKIANLDVFVSNVVRSETDYEYRNKLQLPVREKNGIATFGFYAENSHRIIDIQSCPIQQSWTDDVIKIVRNYMFTYSVSAYSDETKKGLIKHIVARNVSGSILLVLVINGKKLPFYKKLIEMLNESSRKYSLFISENTSENNVILGKEIKLLYGQETFNAIENGIKYSIGPYSFMQVNDSMRSKLYNEVIKCANPTENTVCIDAYSGAGLLTAMLSKKSKKAIGIEIVPEAVNNADILSAENGLQDKMFNHLGSCEELLPNIIEKERHVENEIVLVLDPPRKGCDKKVLHAILKSKPDKIVYVSCSPQTLARDVGILVDELNYKDGKIMRNENPSSQYKIEMVKPFDLFPQTKHVETIVLLTKI